MKQTKKETNSFPGEACEKSNGRNFEKTAAASALEKPMKEKNESAFREIRTVARRLTNSQSFINVTGGGRRLCGAADCGKHGLRCCNCGRQHSENERYYVKCRRRLCYLFSSGCLLL